MSLCTIEYQSVVTAFTKPIVNYLLSFRNKNGSLLQPENRLNIADFHQPSQAPWESGEELEEEEPSSEEAFSAEDDSGSGEDEAEAASGKAAANPQEGAPKKGKAGKPKGAPGHSRQAKE